MSFIGNQLINMMTNKIKQNNHKIAPYLDEIQGGGNTTEILQKAINNGDITRQQWQQAKPFLVKFGKQYGVNVSDSDVQAIENSFNQRKTNDSFSNNNGFRF